MQAGGKICISVSRTLNDEATLRALRIQHPATVLSIALQSCQQTAHHKYIGTDPSRDESSYPTARIHRSPGLYISCPMTNCATSNADRSPFACGPQDKRHPVLMYCAMLAQEACSVESGIKGKKRSRSRPNLQSYNNQTPKRNAPPQGGQEVPIRVPICCMREKAEK